MAKRRLQKPAKKPAGGASSKRTNAKSTSPRSSSSAKRARSTASKVRSTAHKTRSTARKMKSVKQIKFSTNAFWLLHHLALMSVFTVIGMVLALYALYIKYFEAGSSTWCNLSTNFNCDIVNQSVYSEIWGVPVALIGFFGFLVLCIAAMFTSHRLHNLREMLKYGVSVPLDFMAIFSVIGFLFSGYLQYVEWQVLKTWCVVCIATFLTMTIVMIISVWNVRHLAQSKKHKKKGKPEVCDLC